MRPTRFQTKTALYGSYIVAFILVLLPFHALLSTWLGSNTGHLDLIRIWKEIIGAALFGFAVGLYLSVPALKKFFAKDKVLLLFVLYVLIHLVAGWSAMAAHRVNFTAFIYALVINLRFIGFYVICYVFGALCSYLRLNWHKILLVPASIVVAFGLLQEFLLSYNFLRHFGYGPATIPAYQTVDSDINYQRVQSTLRGANPLGAYLVVVIPAILVIAKKSVRYIFLAAALVTLFYTYSRSAWIGTAATLLLLGVYKTGASRRTKEIAAAFILAAVLVAVGIYSLRTNHTAQNTFFHINSSSPTVSPNTKHAASVKAAAKDLTNQPLGEGPGTAGPASFRNTGHQPRIAENYYLQIGQELGFAGLAIFVAINLLVGLRLWQKRAEVLPQILLASLVGLSLVNLVSHAWADDTLSILWWSLAGIATAPVILGLGNKHNKNGAKPNKTT
jgi:hypothetical protein